MQKLCGMIEDVERLTVQDSEEDFLNEKRRSNAPGPDDGGLSQQGGRSDDDSSL